jgi:hypothetical protein
VPNLYLSHTGRLIFVATLSSEDDRTPELYGTRAEPQGDWYRTFAGRTSEVSPNGQYLAFMAKENLTGYETVDAIQGVHDYEAYIYEAATHKLVCASCNTDGSLPTSSTLLPPSINGLYQQRYVDDAGRLFFSTQDPVLPEDTNGTSDVYEYEDGHVHLISPGDAPYEAVFADASASGNDVFFTTNQQLVPADHDQIVDLYDARVGGTPEAPSLPLCAGEACHEQALSSSSFAAPVSAEFTGPGNSEPPAPQLAGTTHGPAASAQAQKKLAAALKACRFRQNRHRRADCEKQALKRYGPKVAKRARRRSR